MSFFVNCRYFCLIFMCVCHLLLTASGQTETKKSKECSLQNNAYIRNCTSFLLNNEGIQSCFLQPEGNIKQCAKDFSKSPCAKLYKNLSCREMVKERLLQIFKTTTSLFVTTPSQVQTKITGAPQTTARMSNPPTESPYEVITMDISTETRHNNTVFPTIVDGNIGKSGDDGHEASDDVFIIAGIAGGFLLIVVVILVIVYVKCCRNGDKRGFVTVANPEYMHPNSVREQRSLTTRTTNSTKSNTESHQYLELADNPPPRPPRTDKLGKDTYTPLNPHQPSDDQYTGLMKVNSLYSKDKKRKESNYEEVPQNDPDVEKKLNSEEVPRNSNQKENQAQVGATGGGAEPHYFVLEETAKSNKPESQVNGYHDNAETANNNHTSTEEPHQYFELENPKDKKEHVYDSVSDVKNRSKPADTVMNPLPGEPHYFELENPNEKKN